MPRGDRSGPMGMGPMSGRAAGYCAGFGMPGYANPMWGYGRGRRFGMGFGRGRGGGMGFGRGWGSPYGPAWFPGRYPAQYAEPDPETEKQALKSQAQALQSELEMIKKRLEEVEASTAEK